ncbi:MAG: hypothetical protein ACE37F_30100 [Nannocystaceae bacterium]|nr:hypothetical protein [bacterium]
MKTHAIQSTLLAALLSSSACYTGLDATGELGFGDSTIGGATDATAGDGSDDAPDDDGPDEPDGDGEDPEPAEDEDPFELPGTEARLLPFHVRMTNLANLVGVEKDHFIFDELYMRRIQLGDHDFSGNIAADLAWNAQKMSVWVKSLEPVCGSIQFRDRYPNVSANPTPLLQQVMAREPDAEELEAYAAIVAGAPDTATADLLTCYAALSSLEFVCQ